MTEPRIQSDCRPAPHRRLEDIIVRVSGSLPSPSPGQARALQRLHDLLQRLEDSRFHLAVLGHFKRGKSTLLNALLGVPLLPAAVVPLTAISTFLQAAPVPRLRAISPSGTVEEITADQSSDLAMPLARLVTEDGNPRNKLDLLRVEIAMPNALLEKGVVLIDTPGVGSTFVHNTEQARTTLPECDAAIFVVSTDPPITETEIVFLAEILRHVTHLIVVLNKVDLVNVEDLATGLSFLRRTLTERIPGAEAFKLFPLSARDALQAKLAGDEAALLRSGLPALERYLSKFLAREKREILTDAIVRKTAIGIDEILMEIEIKLEALRMPMYDLDARIETLSKANERLETERRTAHDQTAGDRRRSLAQIETDAKHLRERALKVLKTPIDHATGPIRDIAAVRSQAMRLVPLFFEDEREKMSSAMTDQIIAAANAHRRRTMDLVDMIRRAATDLMNVPPVSAAATDQLDFHHEPYWVQVEQLDALKPFPRGVLDRFLPGGIRDVRLRKRLRGEIEAIVRRNVENLRWAILQNVEDTFRRLDADLDESATASIEATQGAIVEARRLRVARQDCLSLELAETEAALIRLRKSRQAIAEMIRRKTE